MQEYRFVNKLGSHLSNQELAQAADVLSRAYTKWQNNPKNTNPVVTDTSPEVYARMLGRGVREAILYYEGDTLCGVFVHSMSPNYDQYPLRKLSFMGAFPLTRGYESLKAVFMRYAGFTAEQGEDVIITSDLDQTTLNSLLEAAGFREVVDRNEIYHLLSQLLMRKVFKAQKVRNDFVVDEIITCDGKAVRRDKRVYKLQTTPHDFYDIYRNQQRKRVLRSVPEKNLEILAESFSHYQEGVFFVSDFNGCVTLRDRDKGGFDSRAAIVGTDFTGMFDQILDREEGVAYLIPGSIDEVRAIARQVVLRPGFFDFLSYSFKILGSFFVTTGVTPYEVEEVLGRFLHPKIRLRFKDLIEQILSPDMEIIPGRTRKTSDGILRTAYKIGGPFIDLKADIPVRKEAMIEHILKLKRSSPAPIVYLGNDVDDMRGVSRLYQESLAAKTPVLVFDFKDRLSKLVCSQLLNGNPDSNPYFSVVNIRDFYQIPVMLESMGLSAGLDVELNLAG